MIFHSSVIAETRAWVNRVVIGLNLCPFAKAVEIKNQIRYVVTDAGSLEDLEISLRSEILFLARIAPAEVETTLLIHPNILKDFAAYNDFLEAAESLIRELGYEGILQVASFHPRYQFAGTDADDISNATNQSPYPTLHLLREESVSRAVDSYPDTASIFQNNILTMKALGREGWAQLREKCRKDSLGPTGS